MGKQERIGHSLGAVSPVGDSAPEPPHARTWQEIRKACGWDECEYPFCDCAKRSRLEREIAEMETKAGPS